MAQYKKVDTHNGIEFEVYVVTDIDPIVLVNGTPRNEIQVYCKRLNYHQSVNVPESQILERIAVEIEAVKYKIEMAFANSVRDELVKQGFVQLP